jgi:hypothetical protein
MPPFTTCRAERGERMGQSIWGRKERKSDVASVSKHCHMPACLSSCHDQAHANHSVSSSIKHLVLPNSNTHSMSPSSIATGLPQWPANPPLSPR